MAHREGVQTGKASEGALRDQRQAVAVQSQGYKMDLGQILLIILILNNTNILITINVIWKRQLKAA